MSGLKRKTDYSIKEDKKNFGTVHKVSGPRKLLFLFSASSGRRRKHVWRQDVRTGKIFPRLIRFKVKVGWQKLVGEVIKLDHDKASI
jgi:hypothetical protein